MEVTGEKNKDGSQGSPAAARPPEWGVVWKFSLYPFTTLDMPKGARILSIQVQHGQAQMWVFCDPSKPTETRTFEVHPTGVTFCSEGLEYLGTFQMAGGDLVFHAFEKIAARAGG